MSNAPRKSTNQKSAGIWDSIDTTAEWRPASPVAEEPTNRRFSTSSLSKFKRKFFSGSGGKQNAGSVTGGPSPTASSPSAESTHQQQHKYGTDSPSSAPTDSLYSASRGYAPKSSTSNAFMRQRLEASESQHADELAKAKKASRRGKRDSFLYQEAPATLLGNIKHHVLYAVEMLGRFDKQTDEDLQLDQDDIVYVIRECQDLRLFGMDTRGNLGYFGETFCRRLNYIPPVLDPEVDSKLIFEHEVKSACKLILSCWRRYKGRKKMIRKLRKISKRKFVLKEWIDQERIYLQDLKALHDLYYQPLKRTPVILNAKDFNECFEGFPSVYEVGVSFCEEFLQCDGDERRMLRLFNERCEEFKSAYLTFVVKLDTAIPIISENLSTNDFFKQFAATKKRDPMARNKTLLDLRMKPFQSLIHTQNIICRLHKGTPPDSYTYQLLEEAEKNIVTTIEYINNEKKRTQNAKTLKSLQDEIHNFDLVKAWRYPVYSGQLLIQTANSSHLRPLKAHLMNDVFLFVKKRKLHIFYLIFTRLQVDMSDPQNLHMHLDNGITHVNVKFKNSAEKARWVKAFAECYASEKEFTRENNIQSSVHQMFVGYWNTVKQISDISKKMDKQGETFRYYHKKIDESTQKIEARRKSFVAFVLDQQSQRKRLLLQAQEMRKDYDQLRNQRLEHASSTLHTLDTFKTLMRRDEKNFEELFGETHQRMVALKKDEENLFPHRKISNADLFFKFRTEKELEYDPELELLNSPHNIEMENVRQLLKTLNANEHSFKLLSSASAVQAQIQSANETIQMMRNKNRELKAEVTRLHDVIDSSLKMKDDAKQSAGNNTTLSTSQTDKIHSAIKKINDSSGKTSLEEQLLALQIERDSYKKKAEEQEQRSNDLMVLVNDLRNQSSSSSSSNSIAISGASNGSASTAQDALLKRKIEQNHRLQEEIIFLQEALDESRREKASIIQESRSRARGILQVHSSLLQDRADLMESLKQEREKNSQLHQLIHRLHVSNLESTKRSWVTETALDVQRQNTEQLRIHALSDHYKMAFLEREVMKASSTEKES